jgi:hypothetical protein
MGYYNAAKQVKYILGKFYYEDVNDSNNIKSGEWGYLNLAAYGYSYDENGTCMENDLMYDDGTEITFNAVTCKYVEFAVTDIAPADPSTSFTDISDVTKATTYTGDPLLFEAETGLLYNPTQTYQSAPFAEKVTPSTTGRLIIGSTYDVSVTYDQDLKLDEGFTEDTLGYNIVCTAPDGRATTGAEYAKVTDIKWDGNRTVTFKFTPSEYYADNTVCYDIQITGLVGKETNKKVNSVRYACSYGCKAFAYTAEGYDWNVFGQPALMENVNLNVDTSEEGGWKVDDNEVISSTAKDRFVLVTTRTAPAQEERMTDMVEDYMEDNDTSGNIVATETYNIGLTLCKSQVLKTGDGVRVSIGFPEGYSADDEGVTFKAYHFKKNDAGETIGVEPIDCVVTKYGLIITCTSFSPFEIVAVTDAEEETTKKVVLTYSDGGDVTVKEDSSKNAEIKNNIISLNEGGSVTFTITPSAEYAIDSINYLDKNKTISANDDGTMEFTVKYDDIKDLTTAGVLDINFVAKSVVEKNKANNQTAAEIASATAEYKTFRTALDSENSESKENQIQPGSTVKVTFKTTDLSNSKNGIVAMCGQLVYNNNVLELVKTDNDNVATGDNGWDASSFNEGNLKFVTDNDNIKVSTSEYIKTTGDVFTLTFKVKDNVFGDSEDESMTTDIYIKDIKASDGKDMFTSTDAKTTLTIMNTDNNEEINVSSEKYTIEKENGVNYISKISTKTTVADFVNKLNIESSIEGSTPNFKIVKDDENNTVVYDSTASSKADAYIGTGMKLIVTGEKESLEYVIIVTGDIDGDGELGVIEIAKIKLHIIEKTPLTGINLKAANIDESTDGEVTIVDLARAKLIYVGLLENNAEQK